LSPTALLLFYYFELLDLDYLLLPLFDSSTNEAILDYSSARTLSLVFSPYTLIEATSLHVFVTLAYSSLISSTVHFLCSREFN
jgi:hypothetical protein